MIDTGLDGKIVLITGANHGTGAATAGAFADEGTSVSITYLRLNAEMPASRVTGAEEVGGPGGEWPATLDVADDGAKRACGWTDQPYEPPDEASAGS